MASNLIEFAGEVSTLAGTLVAKGKYQPIDAYRVIDIMTVYGLSEAQVKLWQRLYFEAKRLYPQEDYYSYYPVSETYHMLMELIGRPAPRS